jgi:hypothetical protein
MSRGAAMSTDPIAESTTSRRTPLRLRWPRFGTRGLLALVVLVAAIVAPQAVWIRREQALIQGQNAAVQLIVMRHDTRNAYSEVERSPEQVRDDVNVTWNGVTSTHLHDFLVEYEPANYPWLVQSVLDSIYGPDFFHRVVGVTLSKNYSLPARYETDGRQSDFDFPPGDHDLELLVAFPYLRSLTLRGEAITGRGLANLTELSRLRSLKLSYTALAGDDLLTLRELAALEELTILGSAIDGPGVAAISQCITLRTLDIGGNLKDDDLRSIANLKQLETLHIRSSKLRGSFLADLSRCPALRSLSLDTSEPFHDDSFAHFDRLHQLRELRLRILTDDGATHLASMERLRVLNLQSSPITDASVETISKLRRLENLTILQTNITPAGTARLRTALPHCLIHY